MRALLARRRAARTRRESLRTWVDLALSAHYRRRCLDECPFYHPLPD